MTKFFEVIKVSAPHIYHSALELSPQSAIVRRLYYYYRPHLTPRAVRGVPSLWNQPLTIKTNHKFSTWSPCGKSLAVATPNNVEIWDILTLGKRSTLCPTNPSHKLWDTPGQGILKDLPSGIAYSPDGHSLACYSSSSTAIIIWDIQTGGVVNSIGCGAVGTTFESLVWSFDGKTIGAIFASGQGWVVCVCDVALGTMVSPGLLQSLHKPYLWPHDKLLQILTTSGRGCIEFNIYVTGSPLSRTISRARSFSIRLPHHSNPQTISSISFSPTTGQISFVTNKHALLVFHVKNSKVLLEEAGNFHGNCFSPDGSLLVSSQSNHIHVWQNEHNHYSPWRKVPFQGSSGDPPQDLQFSPTSLSVLISREGFLEVVHLDDPEANPPKPPPCQYAKISTNGAYIVTADWGRSTITITNLHSQIPSWFINIDSQIYGLALTGNILLVKEEYGFIAWRLTAEGAVEGFLGNEAARWCHGIWHCRGLMHGLVEFLVTGDTGIIRYNKNHLFYYNTVTGCEFAPIQVPTSSTLWHNLTDSGFYTHLHYHSFCEHNNPLEHNQLSSIPSYKEGWVKYPEGKHPHKFWLPAHWMANCGHNAYWLSDITTLWLHGRELVVIKF